MRKLLLAASGYALALLGAHYLLPYEWLPWAAALCGVPALALAVFRFRRKAAALILAGAAFGLLWTWGYTALTVLPAEAFAGQRRTVAVEVTRCACDYGGYSRIEVRSVDPEVPHVRMLVYDYGGGLGELRPGDRVSMPLKLLSAGKRYGPERDGDHCEGIHLRGYTAGAYTVTGRARRAWLYFPLELAERVKAQALRCFPADVAPLMKALLTGDRTEYYLDDDLYSAMRTAGMVHVIAVSGMHVAFLVNLLRLATGRRRITAFLGIPLIVVFMAMIGFTPSVVRAGVMEILLLLAPLLQREDDPPTSLAAAGLLILLVNPLAVGSLGFQLSFAAMAGLILVSPRVFDWLAYGENGRYRLPRGLPGKLPRWACGVFSASAGALVFTNPIVALRFGSVPLYAVLANLLCLWPISTAFLWGYAVCLLGALWQPLGPAAGRVVGWLPRCAVFIVKRIARLPFATLYTRRNLGGWWLVFVYLLFSGAYALRGKERFRPVLPVCAALSSLALVLWFGGPEPRDRLTVTAVDVGQGQCVVAMTGSAVTMMDCGGDDGGAAGDAAADYLQKNGRDRVDLLVLTHFDADHVNGVRRLLSRVTVRRLAIPPEYGESAAAADILSACGARGTEVFVIAENTRFEAENLALTVYAPLGVGERNESGLIIYGDFGSFEFLVTGDAGSAVERALTDRYDLGDIELLVCGHHGSRGSTSDALLDAVTPEAAFLSVGEGNRYGHPAEETLRRLEERTIGIYRTDLDGTVSLTVERDNGESN